LSMNIQECDKLLAWEPIVVVWLSQFEDFHLKYCIDKVHTLLRTSGVLRKGDVNNTYKCLDERDPCGRRLWFESEHNLCLTGAARLRPCAGNGWAISFRFNVQDILNLSRQGTPPKLP
jgi:hypothetical protein